MQSSIRSLPPTIVEENDNDIQNELEEKHPMPLNGSQPESALHTLEDQNRVLRERLASQQTVLDRLLGTKLHATATAPLSSARSRRLKLQLPLGTSHKRNENDERKDGHRERHHELSPTAA